MNRSLTSTGSNTKTRVTVAFFTSKNANISRALFSFSLLQYGLIGSPCRFKAFVDRMPNLRQGLIRGVFQTKASLPWAGNKSERVQVSLCLPNERDLDTWYEAVSTLPIAWPDITDTDPHYFKKTSAHILLAIRTQMGVSHMWGEISPQWHLLRHHLWNLGPGYRTLSRTAYPQPARRCQGLSLTPHIGSNGGTGKLLNRRCKIWPPI